MADPKPRELQDLINLLSKINQAIKEYLDNIEPQESRQAAPAINEDEPVEVARSIVLDSEVEVEIDDDTKTVFVGCEYNGKEDFERKTKILNQHAMFEFGKAFGDIPVSINAQISSNYIKIIVKPKK